MSHFEDDMPVAFQIDLDGAPRLGDVYLGRITAFDSRWAWVDVGSEKPAILKHAEGLYEGQSVVVRIKREAVQGNWESKGPMVVLAHDDHDGVLSDSHQGSGIHPPALLEPSPPRWLAYLETRKLDDGLGVVLNHSDLLAPARNCLGTDFEGLILDTIQPLPVMIGQAWDELLGVLHPIPSGGHLVLEETTPAVIIDVNTSSLQGVGISRSPGKYPVDRLRFNMEAAQAVMALIHMRGLEGVIFVDFPGIDDPRLDRRFLGFLREKARSVKGLRVAGITPGGWIELRKSLTGPGLLERYKRLEVDK